MKNKYKFFIVQIFMVSMVFTSSMLVVPDNYFSYADTSLHPVGGRIWKVDTSAAGATYEFYDINKQPLSLTDAQKNSVASLGSAAYYTVQGVPNKDKYYVVATTNGNPASNFYTLGSKKKWSYQDSTWFGADNYGDGEANSKYILASPCFGTDSPLFSWLKSTRDSNWQGCNDWYIPSIYEIWDMLEKNMNNATSLKNTIFWSSTENTNKWARTYTYSKGRNGYGRFKCDGKYSTFLFRKFGGASYKVTYKIGNKEIGHIYCDAGKLAKPSNNNEWNRMMSGYTVTGWYTDEGLTQSWNINSDLVSGNMTLFASGPQPSLNVTSQTPVIYYKTTSQNITLSCSGGTGFRTFSIVSQPSGAGFTISNNYRGTCYLVVPAGILPGEYELQIKATDKYSGATGEGIYDITVNKASGAVTLKSADNTKTYNTTTGVNLLYPDSVTLNVASPSGTMSASIDNPSIATISCDSVNKKITLFPQEVSADASTTLTITTDETDLYSPSTTTYKVSVGRLNVITNGFENLEYDGDPHGLNIKVSNVSGATVYYDISDDASYDLGSVTLAQANVDYLLDTTEALLTAPGSKTIYYKVVKQGYNDVTGDAEISIIDTIKPTALITSTTDDADVQTLTMSGYDTQGISAYYFGTSPDEFPDRDLSGDSTVNIEEEVSADATYYFVTEDDSGNVSEPATITLYKTGFEVKHGTSDANTLLLPAGISFILPNVTADAGYINTKMWRRLSDGTIAGMIGSEYLPTKSDILVATCSYYSYAKTYRYDEGKQFAKPPKVDSKSVKLSFKNLPGVTSYKIYGNLAGKKIKAIKELDVSNTSYTIKKIGKKKLEANKVYKFKIAAYRYNEKLVENTIVIINANKKSKYANATNIIVPSTKYSMAVGMDKKLNVKVKMPKGKKHLPAKYGPKLTYSTSNPYVATVDKKGTIHSKMRGSATIYIQELSGLSKEITVDVN